MCSPVKRSWYPARRNVIFSPSVKFSFDNDHLNAIGFFPVFFLLLGGMYCWSQRDGLRTWSIIEFIIHAPTIASWRGSCSNGFRFFSLFLMLYGCQLNRGLRTTNVKVLSLQRSEKSSRGTLECNASSPRLSATSQHHYFALLCEWHKGVPSTGTVDVQRRGSLKTESSWDPEWCEWVRCWAICLCLGEYWLVRTPAVDQNEWGVTLVSFAQPAVCREQLFSYICNFQLSSQMIYLCNWLFTLFLFIFFILWNWFLVFNVDSCSKC